MSSDAFAEPVVVPDQRTSKATLNDLRKTRQRRRLGDTDWYDIAYRVYLFGLVGLTLVVWVSDAVDGAIGDGIDSADLLARGPSIVGLLVVAAFALGVRSGADGGPVAIEVADIRHVLLSPISRRSVMLRPVAQRLRAAAFALGLGGAVLGQLIATEVEGSRTAWAAACGAFGAIVGVTFVATAVIAHTLRVPRWLATMLAALALVWQGAVAWGIWHDETTGWQRVAPGNLAGRLALWGVDQRPVDVIAIVIAVAMTGRRCSRAANSASRRSYDAASWCRSSALPPPCRTFAPSCNFGASCVRRCCAHVRGANDADPPDRHPPCWPTDVRRRPPRRPPTPATGRRRPPSSGVATADRCDGCPVPGSSVSPSSAPSEAWVPR